MDFTSLQHIRDRRSTCREVSEPRYVPPSGFGYPLDGLLPPSPCRFCFTPAALMGFTLRSFPLSKGIRRVTARKHPHTVFPSGTPAAEAEGPTGRPRFLGFHPFESPSRTGVGLAHRPPAAPLGFALLGSADESLGRDFARPPLTRFCGTAASSRIRRRPRVSIGSRRVPCAPSGGPLGADGTTLLGFVPPALSRAFGRRPVRAMCSPHAASCIAADRPAILGQFPSPYRSYRDPLRCRTSATSTSQLII